MLRHLAPAGRADGSIAIADTSPTCRPSKTRRSCASRSPTRCTTPALSSEPTGRMGTAAGRFGDGSVREELWDDGGLRELFMRRRPGPLTESAAARPPVERAKRDPQRFWISVLDAPHHTAAGSDPQPASSVLIPIVRHGDGAPERRDRRLAESLHAAVTLEDECEPAIRAVSVRTSGRLSPTSRCVPGRDCRGVKRQRSKCFPVAAGGSLTIVR